MALVQCAWELAAGKCQHGLRNRFPQGKVRKGQLADFAVIAILVLGLVEMGGVRCDPRAKPHGKRPAGAQRRKQTIPKSANIIPACGIRGPRWRKDASPSTFLPRFWETKSDVIRCPLDVIRCPLEVTAACKRISTRPLGSARWNASNQKYTQPCFT